MQGVGDGALEALGLAGDLPLKYVCCDALLRSFDIGGRTGRMQGPCMFEMVDLAGMVLTVFLRFFSDNPISAAAAARFVHYTVALEHMDFSVDREFYCFSLQLESDAYLLFSFSRASFGMPRMVAAEAASRGP